LAMPNRQISGCAATVGATCLTLRRRNER
jgi:hypothetical protein